MTKAIPRLQPRKKRQNLSGNATLVIVEGQTEEKYFSDLSNYHRNLSTFVLRGQGTDPVSLVEYAAKLYNTGRQGNSRQQRASAKCFPAKLFDKIFIVFDEDEKPEQRKKALDAIKSFNKRNKSVKMTACDSRPNFELWLLLPTNPFNQDRTGSPTFRRSCANTCKTIPKPWMAFLPSFMEKQKQLSKTLNLFETTRIEMKGTVSQTLMFW